MKEGLGDGENNNTPYQMNADFDNSIGPWDNNNNNNINTSNITNTSMIDQ